MNTAQTGSMGMAATGRANGGITRSSASGFTLLELLVVLAIIGILSTIAYASYVDSVVKSRRAAAATCLQERAQFMERFYTTNLSYADAPDPAQCGADLNEYYRVDFVGTPGAKTFEIQADPEGTQESRDTKCATLTINAQGVRTESGSGTVGECW